MFSKETTTLLQQQFSEIPQILRSQLQTENFRMRIKDIAEKNNLPREKQTLFENEVALMFLTFEPYQDLEENLVSSLTISAEKAKDLTEDVFEIFFTKEILRILENIYAEREKGGDGVVSENQSPTPVPQTVAETTSEPVTKRKERAEMSSSPAVPEVPRYRKPLVHQGKQYRNANLYGGTNSDDSKHTK